MSPLPWLLSSLVLGAGPAELESSPVRFSPAKPRLGDPVVLYIKEADPTVLSAPVHLLGYEYSAFRTGPDELRAVAAVPLHIDPDVYPVEVRLDDERVLKTRVTIHDREFETSELRVSRKFTKRKSRKLRRRIRRESKAISAVWKKEPTPPRNFGSPIRPVSTEVTGLFGTKRMFNEKIKSRHYGLDLDGEIGDPIRAVADGKVVLSSLRFYSGGTIILDHGGGLFTLYFHMSRRDRKVGDVVRAGDLLGAVGKSGRVTGPHLHLAVAVRAVALSGRRRGKSRSLYVDPETFLALPFRGDPTYVPKGVADPSKADEEHFGGQPAGAR